MLIKRSFSLAGHRTSVALEEAFWQALAAISSRQGIALSALVARIDATRAAETSLASALRVLSLDEAVKSVGAQNTSQDRVCD